MPPQLLMMVSIGVLVALQGCSKKAATDKGEAARASALKKTLPSPPAGQRVVVGSSEWLYSEPSETAPHRVAETTAGQEAEALEDFSRRFGVTDNLCFIASEWTDAWVRLSTGCPEPETTHKFFGNPCEHPFLHHLPISLWIPRGRLKKVLKKPFALELDDGSFVHARAGTVVSPEDAEGARWIHGHGVRVQIRVTAQDVGESYVHAGYLEGVREAMSGTYVYFKEAKGRVGEARVELQDERLLRWEGPGGPGRPDVYLRAKEDERRQVYAFNPCVSVSGWFEAEGLEEGGKFRTPPESVHLDRPREYKYQEVEAGVRAYYPSGKVAATLSGAMSFSEDEGRDLEARRCFQVHPVGNLELCFDRTAIQEQSMRK